MRKCSYKYNNSCPAVDRYGKFTCALIGLDILFWKSPPVSGGERSKGVSTHKQPPLHRYGNGTKQ